MGEAVRRPSGTARLENGLPNDLQKRQKVADIEIEARTKHVANDG